MGCIEVRSVSWGGVNRNAEWPESRNGGVSHEIWGQESHKAFLPPLFHSHGRLHEELSPVGNDAFRACWHFSLMLYRCCTFEETLDAFT